MRCRETDKCENYFKVNESCLTTLEASFLVPLPKFLMEKFLFESEL